ncbi:hypothetical protein BC628DRAFT_1410207 [Trametes gibbosa]|nr:hypothetical protein BC628DRAFT_1410207 [Trametes gibbosa]
MRQRLSFLALTALSHGFVSAAVTGVARARAINAHALRYSAAQRGFSDSCLYLNSTTLVGLDPSEVPVGLPSDLDSCFCMSSLLESLTTSVQLAYTVNTLGITAVQQAFGFIISHSPQSQTCTYPDNSQPLCTRDNVCGFTCDSPFTAIGDTCVCTDSDVCSSLQLSARKTSSKSRLAKRAVIKTTAEAQATCAVHETVCGKYNEIQSGFQCVDVRTNLEICGGCIVPSPFDSPKKGSVAGVDCSSIPHVENVSCQAGACAVRSCGDGWTVNKDGTGCIAVAASLGAGADISLREVPDGIEVGAAGEAGAQDLWHTARTLSEKKKLKEDWTRIPDIRSEDVAEADSGGARVAPKKIQQDWVRIPDYRRFGLE